jgi:hypothetical protein
MKHDHNWNMHIVKITGLLVFINTPEFYHLLSLSSFKGSSSVGISILSPEDGNISIV